MWFIYNYNFENPAPINVLDGTEEKIYVRIEELKQYDLDLEL